MVSKRGKVEKGSGNRFAGSIVAATLRGAPEALPVLQRYFSAAGAFLTTTALSVSVHLASSPVQEILIPAALLHQMYLPCEEGHALPIPGARNYLAALLASTTACSPQEQGGARQLTAFGEGKAVICASCIVHATALHATCKLL